MQQGANMQSPAGGNNQIIMQDVQVSDIGGLASGVVGTPMDQSMQSQAAH